MELRIKIVPRAIATSSSWALIIGAIAAIALPPQMAVPADIRYEIFLLIDKIYQSAIQQSK